MEGVGNGLGNSFDGILRGRDGNILTTGAIASSASTELARLDAWVQGLDTKGFVYADGRSVILVRRRGGWQVIVDSGSKEDGKIGEVA